MFAQDAPSIEMLICAKEKREKKGQCNCKIAGTEFCLNGFIFLVTNKMADKNPAWKRKLLHRNTALCILTMYVS